MMMTRAILWPTFALVALAFAVSIALLRGRGADMRRQLPTVPDPLDADAAPAGLCTAERPAANLANLFELPVLYFALVPLLLLTGLAGLAQVVLAWLYVALRTGHSIAQLAGHARLRFGLFMTSTGMLATMWIGFAIDLGFSAR